MAAIKKLPSGSWCAQIRRKGHYLSGTFLLRKDAEAWARRMESEIDQGKTPAPKKGSGDKQSGRPYRPSYRRYEVRGALYRAVALIEEQRLSGDGNSDRIFPYNGRSVGTAFRRACRDLEIVDLHFHDLRHEGTSRLFEAGFSIEQVALVTGHKDWKMLRRYTHLKPDSLHSIAERLPKVRPVWAPANASESESGAALS